MTRRPGVDQHPQDVTAAPDSAGEQDQARRREEFGTYCYQVILTGILNAKGHRIRFPEAPTREEREAA